MRALLASPRRCGRARDASRVVWALCRQRRWSWREKVVRIMKLAFASQQWYRLALIVIAFDQLSKMLASLKLVYGEPMVVLPVFNLMLAHNQGAAFSFLHDAGGWQRWLFSGLAAVVSVVLIVWIKRVSQQKLLASGLALVLGGAVGNLIDRVRFGYVVDFL